MENVLSVAKMFNDLYKADFGTDMDEMRMHKMMYFAQRESLLQVDGLLFDATFYGWRSGPGLKEIKHEYMSSNPFSQAFSKVTDSAKKLIINVYHRYGSLTLWKLETLSFGEVSWKCSREHLDVSQEGGVPLKLANMKLDALRELLNRKKSGEV